MLTTVARFLALLELFRDGAVAFEQLTPLGELTIRWIGGEGGDWTISDEFDESRETREMDELAAKSLAQQADIERDEAGSFDAFVAAYRAYTLNRISV